MKTVLITALALVMLLVVLYGISAYDAKNAVEAQGFHDVHFAGIDQQVCGDLCGYLFTARTTTNYVYVVACSNGGLYTVGWRIVVR